MPHRTTVGRNKRTHQDPAVDNKDSMLSQRGPPSGIKKQVPSIRDIAVQVNQLQQSPIVLGQPSGTPSIKTTAIQADLPQHLPKTDDPQQTKDKSHKDHPQAPKKALNASPYN